MRRERTVCRVDWGPHAVTEAAARGDVVVVVDTLRFSSTVASAVNAGVRVLPVEDGHDAESRARGLGLPLVRSSRHGAHPDRPTDSPLWYASHGHMVAAIVYPSPNGARLVALARDHPVVYVGSLLNATAVGRAAASPRNGGPDVTVVPAGERSVDFDPSAAPRRHFAVEDYLAAGAIAEATELPLSAEAEVAVAAWQGCRQRVREIMRGSVSGRSLVESGRGDEVDYCALVDHISSVPRLRDGWLVAE